MVLLSNSSLNPGANGRNIVGCYMLRLSAHPVACCCVLLGVVAQSFKPVKLLATCKLACVPSVSNRVIARKLEREQKKKKVEGGGGGESFPSPSPSPVIPFFVLVPTFSTNSRGNACYAGYLQTDATVGSCWQRMLRLFARDLILSCLFYIKSQRPINQNSNSSNCCQIE